MNPLHFLKTVFAAASLAMPLTGVCEVIASGMSNTFTLEMFPSGTSIVKPFTLRCAPLVENEWEIKIDGKVVASSTVAGSIGWQPNAKGEHELTFASGENKWTKTVNVTALDFFEQPAPNPPMEKVSSLSITPTTRSFETGGGGGSILVSGSGTWTAQASDTWITLNSATGRAGYPVAYTVAATTNVEQRVGYVYVSGYTHEITQEGIGATVSPTSITKESGGGVASVMLTTSGKWAWDAAPGADWVQVTPTHGVGSGAVTIKVAPYNRVSTRGTTVTVGGTIINVFQYGRRMKLSSYKETRNYETQVVPVVVDAFADTTWSVRPNNSWIAVVDAGNGKGGDTVAVSIGENPSYLARTGTVTIGTETLTIVQMGRTDLSFSISPTSATAPVSGGNGVFAVYATPDLPWTAVSKSDWLTVYGNLVSGVGTGNVVYNASPNPTLFSRDGMITVTPEVALGVESKTLKVTQLAATSAIAPTAYEFGAAGEAATVDVTVDTIVEWTISESLDWITVSGSISRVGPGKVTLTASANNTVYPRSGTVTIAGKKFSVTQKARGVELEYDSKLFGTDGGYDSFTVHPDGNAAWQAIASESTWITVFGAASGTGDAEVQYVIAPYQGKGEPRFGWITVGDKKVYITQRPYELDITPRAATVSGKDGTGEVGVSAGLGNVWRAIVTEPWITIVSGFDTGSGSGTIRFTYTENNTGMVRTGKIIISGEEYILTQDAMRYVPIVTTVKGHGGAISGAGTYCVGDVVELTAVPDSGYEFLGWTGDLGTSTQNPLKFTATTAKTVVAEFRALEPEFIDVENLREGVRLTWQSLAWATSYKIYRAPTSEVPTKELATVKAPTSTYLDTTGAVGQRYFYWVEAIGPVDTTECKNATAGMKIQSVSDISYTNLKGATHTNPATYAEGSAVVFTAPSAVAGYTFAGWKPTQITAGMTGPQTVTANWTANNYTVKFNANGGTGTMSNESFTYDTAKALTANDFTRTGYAFKGWATSSGATSAVYTDKQSVKNLTATAGAIVNLYAVWQGYPYSVKFNANGGSGSMTTLGCTYGEESTLTANVFTRTGYAFLGWATSASGSVVYKNGVSVKNLSDAANATINLYAKWTDTWYVNAATGNNANGGASAADPFKTIQHAIDLAVPGMTIVVADGTYAPINSDNKSITIRSVNGAEKTIIDGGYPAVTNRCVYAGGNDGQTNTVIRGFTIQNGCTIGLTRSPNGAGVAGGTLHDCNVRANHGGKVGGGVAYSQMFGCVISDNEAESGAGAYKGVLNNCQLFSNRSTVNGGGAYMGVLNECVITNNIAQNNGGGLNSVTATNCLVQGNTAYAWGGGVHASTCCCCEIVGNAAALSGGGSGGLSVLDSCVIWNNDAHAGNGGGCINAVVRNCTIIGNRAAGSGGGVFAVSAEYGLFNSVVYGNVAARNNDIDSGVSVLNCCTDDPHFIRAEAGDFRLRYDSPCIDAGDNSYVTNTVDFAGNPRIVNGTIDIGAYEYDAAIDTGHAVQVTSGAGSAIYYEGDTVAIAAVAPIGYTFKEWTGSAADVALLASKKEAMTTLTMPGHAVKLTATYQPNAYSIKYNANGGSGAMSDTLCVYDSNANIGQNGFTREGYTFKGWATTENGPVVYSFGQSVKNLTTEQGGVVQLYAVWRAILSITDVSVRQRYPWNGKVDIAITLFGTEDEVAACDCIIDATNTANRVALPITHIKRNGLDVGSGEVWTRRYVWDAAADIGAVKIDDITLTVSLERNSVQLWENGPYWAKCNVGAIRPEAAGYYFWWGDTIGYLKEGDVWKAVDGYSSSDYFFTECPSMKDPDDLKAEGFVDELGNLDSKYDAATVYLHEPWRMPSLNDCKALIANCTTSWVEIDGVCGQLVRGKDKYESNSIFLPCVGSISFGSFVENEGLYWTSTPADDAGDSFALSFFPENGLGYTRQFMARVNGLPVRPVRDPEVKFADDFEVDAPKTVNFALDCRDGERIADEIERVAFSPGWETDVEGAIATVDINGEVVTNSTESGAVLWMPTKNGTYRLSHVVTVAGQQVGETLGATFVVERFNPETPVITPANGAVFKTETCTVSITCEDEGAIIYYSTNGRTPRQSETYRYKGAFEITETTTVLALAVRGEKESQLAEATITKVEAVPLTLERALDESKLGAVSTGGAAVWTPIEDASAKVGESVAKSGAVGMEEATWLEAKVCGKGTLSFWWKVSCEADPRGRCTYDHVAFSVDGIDVAKLDGEKDWTTQSVTVTSDGEHILRWTYSTDDWEEPGFQDCAWVDGVVWTGDAPDPSKPTTWDEVSDLTTVEGLPEAIKDVAVTKFVAWAKAKGIPMTAEGAASVTLDAYLLNCAPGEETAAAAAFKFSAEALKELMANPSAKPMVGTGNYNGKVKILGATSLSAEDWAEDKPNALFYKAVLEK